MIKKHRWVENEIMEDRGGGCDFRGRVFRMAEFESLSKREQGRDIGPAFIISERLDIYELCDGHLLRIVANPCLGSGDISAGPAVAIKLQPDLAPYLIL